MASLAPTAAAAEIDALFESLVTGLRGEALRAQLAAAHPERSREEIDDAIQAACKCFVDEASDGITGSGRVYKWVRTAAHRSLNRERDRLERQVPVDPCGAELDGIAADAHTPEQQVIEHEEEIELGELTETVTSALPQRQRDVLLLWGANYKRHEIAKRLDVSDRMVKRDLLQVVARARTALARLAGGGCERGESLVVRLACGLADPVEMSQAQLHLARCPRCQQFLERLSLWREKLGATLPLPAAEQTDPGLVERTLHKSLDTLGSLRQHLADGGAQINQQTTATYLRAADPTPLAGARPGAVAAVVAGCLAVGTGTYTCVERGINPFTAIPGLERQAPKQRAKSSPPHKTTPSKAATAEPAPVPPASAPVAAEPVTAPEPAPAPPPATPAPAPAPADPIQPTPQPPPEQSFEPSSPAYSPAASQSSAPASPAPVADGGGSSEFEP